MNNDQSIAIEGDIENIENSKNHKNIIKNFNKKKERTNKISPKFVIVIATNQDN